MADDIDIQKRIQSLIDEEHGLRTQLGAGEISVENENQRLATSYRPSEVASLVALGLKRRLI